MNTNQAKALLEKYLAGTCTKEEKALLETWYLQQQLGDFQDLDDADRLQDMKRIRRSLQMRKTTTRRLSTGFMRKAAAVLAVALITGGLYVYTRKTDTLSPAAVEQASLAVPGGDRAILSFDNGTTINLSTDKEGIIAKGGTVTYDDGTALANQSDAQAGTIRQASLTTPAGGQYRITLSDGTRVWLNAATTLRYPLTFVGRERRVEVSGEAYFEVANNPSVPFKVSTQQQTIEVLGTHFNVSAYEDDKTTKTTLLQGSVKVNSPHRSEYLFPGQQAQVTAESIHITDQLDLESIISWKQGYFKFNENIEGIMNKIARWYDVDVVYQNGVDLQQTFSGKMSRSRDLADLLKLMEITGSVHFKIEGRRVTVMP